MIVITTMAGWRDVQKTHILTMLGRFSLPFCMLRDLTLSTRTTKDFFIYCKTKKNMNVQSFNFQYTRRNYKGKLAQFSAIDQTYFHHWAFIWKNPWWCFGHGFGLSSVKIWFSDSYAFGWNLTLTAKWHIFCHLVYIQVSIHWCIH